MKRIGLALSICVAVSLYGSAMVHAWYQNPRDGRYAFGPNTFVEECRSPKTRNECKMGRVRKDPMNVLFNGGNRVVDDEEMISTAWRRLDPLTSLVPDGDCLSHQQLELHFPFDKVQDDRQWATYQCSHNRHHTRLWDSVEWDQAHSDRVKSHEVV